MPHATPNPGRVRWLVLGALWLTGPGLPAQAPSLPPVTAPPDLKRDPVLPRDLNPAAAPPAPAEPPGRPHRIRLFRIQPGFLSDPVGLEQDEPGPPDVRPAEPAGGPEWITVALGNDNPFFDMRQRGDPGGVGFYRVNTQVQLFDTATTACTIGLQAVAPAGLEFDGLPDRAGPTVVTPAVSLFHSLGGGAAVQGFVGRHLAVSNAAAAPVQKAVQYGMAVQRPLAAEAPGLSNLYLYLGALGQYRLEREARSPVVWDVMPGLHWKLADNWWVTGGVMLPVGPARGDLAGQWQVTCSLQF